jgi:hypothetical protein
MESLLWALDLFAVVYLCFWGIRQDSDKPNNKKKGK